MRYLPAHIIFVFVAGLSCAGRDGGRPRSSAGYMVPATGGRQVIEGRIHFEEQMITGNQEPRVLKKLVLSISGQRSHHRKGKQVWIRDVIDHVRLIEGNIPSHSGKVSLEMLYAPEARTFRFRANPPEPFSMLTDMLESTYQLGHFWFPEVVSEGARLTRQLPVTRIIRGQMLHARREVNYRLERHSKSGHQNMMTVSGNYLNADQGTIRVVDIDLESVGKGEVELEYQLDTGVWTRIEVREIVGWATIMFDDTTLAPVNTGTRTVLHLSLHLTDLEK